METVNTVSGGVMPVSKKRTRDRRPPKRRSKTQEARARETQTAQKKAASEHKLTPAAYMRRRIAGWSLVGLAVVVFSTHLLSHLGFYSFASSGIQDLVAGYPMAGLLGVAGAIVLSK
jgi:hypothetical protein